MKTKEMPLRYAALGGDSAYVLCDPIPYIIEIDICTKKVVRKILCPEKINIEGELFSGIYIENNRMALVPLCARNLWIYDLINDEWDRVDISEYVSLDTKYKFNGGQLKSGTLYMFGYDYKGILSVDIASYEMREILEKGDTSGGFKGISTVLKENNMYVLRRNKNEIISIDTNTGQYKLKALNMRTQEANDGIAYDGRFFFVLKNSGNILYKMDEAFLCIEEIAIDECFKTSRNYFEGIECFDNKIIFYGPNCDRYGYIYDIEDNNKSHILNDTVVYAKKFSDSEVLILKKGIVEILDTKKGDACGIHIDFNNEEFQDCLKNIDIERSLFTENDIFGLEELISLIEQ